MPREGRLAVALHGIEPATFEQCTLIRDWLEDLGVDRVTLLVIPAADHHPFFQRSPALAEWLRERRADGDAIAQQGFVHPRVPVRAREAPDHVRAGRRLMSLAGLRPSGYHAPNMRHAVGARRELISSFDWWIAPGLWRAGTALHSSDTLRVEVHPETFQHHPGRTRALERTLRAEVDRRRAVTYDDLVPADARRPAPEPSRMPGRTA
jgi:predicted deacetylase